MTKWQFVYSAGLIVLGILSLLSHNYIDGVIFIGTGLVGAGPGLLLGTDLLD